VALARQSQRDMAPDESATSQDQVVSVQGLRPFSVGGEPALSAANRLPV